MDWLQTLGGLIVGSGGLIGLLNYFRVRKSRRKGMPQNEQHARRIADQSSLNRYWQQEIATFRKERAAELADMKREITALRRLRHEDAAYIDALEEHIWLRRDPPPPKRGSAST